MRGLKPDGVAGSFGWMLLVVRGMGLFCERVTGKDVGRKWTRMRGSIGGGTDLIVFNDLVVLYNEIVERKRLPECRSMFAR